MLTRTNGILAVLFVAVIAFFSLQITLLQNEIETQASQLETKAAELITAKLSIATVSQVNTNLNSTIDTLTEHLKDERRAVEYVKKYNATVDAKVADAVGKLKGLLQNEDDDCGSRPLPADVVDSMWQHYRPAGGDADS